MSRILLRSLDRRLETKHTFNKLTPEDKKI